MKKLLWVLAPMIAFTGCSDYVIDNPVKKLSVESLVDRGTSLSKGLRKYEVLRKWGQPDKRELIGETKRWGAPLENWTYYAWIPDFPVNYRYVAKDYYLTFQGDILIEIEDKISKPKIEKH